MSNDLHFSVHEDDIELWVVPEELIDEFLEMEQEHIAEE